MRDFMKDIHKTIKILEITLNSMPDNTDIRCHLASLLLSTDNYENAIIHFEKVFLMNQIIKKLY